MTDLVNSETPRTLELLHAYGKLHVNGSSPVRKLFCVLRLHFLPKEFSKTTMSYMNRTYACEELYRQLCSLIFFHSLLPQRLLMPKFEGRFLITVDCFPPQCSPNNFDQNQGTGPSFFIMATCPEASNLWVAVGFDR